MIESVLPEVFERSRKPLPPPQIDLKQWRSVPRRRGRKSNMSPMIVFYISHRPYTTTPRSFRDCRWITSVPCIDQCLEDLSGLCRLTGTQAIWNTILWLLIWEFAKVFVFFGGNITMRVLLTVNYIQWIYVSFSRRGFERRVHFSDLCILFNLKCIEFLLILFITKLTTF